MTLSRSTHYLLYFAAVIVVLCTSGCATTTVIRQHPEFFDASRKIDSVVLLPPEVEVLHLVLSGDNERLPEREQQVQTELSNRIIAILQERGYRVQQLENLMQDDSDTELNFELEQLRIAYNQASAELYEKFRVPEEQANRYHVSLGPIVNQFAAMADADALLFSRYSGFEKSQGLMTKEVISGTLLGALTGTVAVPSPSGGSLEMALIDGTTGEVLWCNIGSTQMNSPAAANFLLDKLPPKNTPQHMAQDEAAIPSKDGDFVQESE